MRAGYKRLRCATRELEALEIPTLPEFEDMVVVTEGRGWGSAMLCSSPTTA